MEESERIRRDVSAAAARATNATAALELLIRRKDYLKELRERGNWLTAETTAGEAPDWVRRWGEYWDGLRSDPVYQGLRAELTSARDALHTPEFEAAIEALRRGQSSGAEYAVSYLEADPWYFRSGYLKGRIARWLRLVNLAEGQRARARKVILRSVQLGSRYEQVEYRKLARRLDTPEFRSQIERLLSHEDESVRRRAALLLGACQLNENRGDLRGAR